MEWGRSINEVTTPQAAKLIKWFSANFPSFKLVSLTIYFTIVSSVSTRRKAPQQSMLRELIMMDQISSPHHGVPIDLRLF